MAGGDSPKSGEAYQPLGALEIDEQQVPLLTLEERRKMPDDAFFKKLPGLPDYVYPLRVKKLAQAFAEKNEPVPMRVTAGQAIPLQGILLIIKTSFLVCYAVLTKFASECVEGGQATYPWWCWGAPMPVFVSAFALDYLSHTYTCVPKYQMTRQFTFCDCDVGYNFWFCVGLVLSGLHVSDMSSDSAFLGTFVRSMECPGSLDWSKIWQETLDSWHMPFLTRWVPRLEVFVWFSWITCISQIIYVLLESVPYGSDIWKVHFEVASENPGEYNHEYTTILHRKEKQNHGSALYALAEINCSQLVLTQELSFASEKADRQYRAWAMSSARGTSCPGPFIKHIRDQMSRGIARVFVAGVLTNGLQLLLQLYILLMRHEHEGKGKLDPTFLGQTLISLSLSTMGLMVRANEGLKRVMLGWKWHMRLKQDIIPEVVPGEIRDGIQARSTWLLMFIVTLLVFTVSCGGICLYSCYKLLQICLHTSSHS